MRTFGKICFFGFLFFSIASATFFAHAQTIPFNQYAPTPKALDMIRNGLLPADLNSGTVSFNIPIYTISDRDFEIPVALHYSSSGFQPARQSGEAGLHWSLQAGGAITREIVGVDDFGEYGIYACDSDLTDQELYQMSEPLVYVNYNTPETSSCNRETCSDLYHFSFMGHSGSFVFNHDGRSFSVFGTKDGKGAYTINYDSVRKSFTITTGDGFKYRFGYDIETDYEITKEKQWNRSAIQPGETPSQFASGQLVTVTWLLDRIEAPNGRTVLFLYDSFRYNSTLPQEGKDVLTTFYRKRPNVVDIISGQTDDSYKSASLTFTSYLKRIVVDSTSTTGRKMAIAFSWYRATDKELSGVPLSKYADLVLPKRRLTQISVYDNTSLIRRSTLSYTISGTRPLLTSVATEGFGTYSMTYNTDTAHPLPGILSNALDFWGYYNGNDNTSDDAISPMEIDDNLDEHIKSGVTFMNPNSTYSKLGLLSTITYPTGGTTTIAYEGNDASKILLRTSYYSGPQPSNPIGGEIPNGYLPALHPTTEMLPSNQCGGVRVSSITDNDGLGGLTVRSFSYTKANGTSSGIIQQFPRFFSGKILGHPEYNPAIKFPGSSFDQLPVAYSRVKEQRSDGSYSITVFSDWEGIPDEYSDHRQYEQWMANNIDTVFYNNILREPDSRAYRRGLPLERKSYRSGGGLVREEEWTYSDWGGNYSAYVVRSGCYWWSARRFLCDRFPVRLDITDYPDDGGEPHEEFFAYGYDTNNLLNLEQHGIGNAVEETRTTYSGTTTIADTVFVNMRNNGVVSLPVDYEHWRGEQPVSAKRTFYTQLDDHHYVPRVVYSAPINVGTESLVYLNTEASYENYDAKGNPHIILSKDSTPTTLFWTDDGKYPSAIIQGAKSGPQTVITQVQQTNTDTQLFNNVLNATKTFTSDVSGPFTLFFENLKTDGTGITATLDGVTLSLWELIDFNTGNPISYTHNSNYLAAGTHTLVLSGKQAAPQPMDPIDPLGVKAGITVKGNLTITYQVIATQTQTVNETNVLFEDFETSGDTGAGIDGGRGRKSNYNQTLTVHAGRKYIIDWMKKDGDNWDYMCETLTPTTGTLTISIPASNTHPIDNIRFYPENADATTWMWKKNMGMSMKTDGRGLSEYYSYDSYGRLIQIKDNGKNAVEEYQYQYAPTSAGNAYIRTLVYRSENSGSFNQINTMYDGLGRPFQTIKKNASPLASGTTTDLVEWTEYDGTGHPFKTWLPISTSAGAGFVPFTTFRSQSGNTYGSGEEAWTQVEYDLTPLDRVQTTLGPGKAWHNAEKSVETEYLTNRGTGPLACLNITASLTGNTGISIQNNGVYAEGLLSVTRTTNEDGRITEEFTDIFGQVLLQRQLVSGSVGSSSTWADTYYLYDAMGRLVAVLPPALSNEVSSSTWNPSSSGALAKISALAYQYRYDNRDRMIAKKLPGAEWIYYVYDKGDRLVLTQDGNQRINSKWLFRVGDILGRECLTGTMTGTYNAFASPLSSTKVIAERGTDYTVLHGYSVQGLIIPETGILTVNWWDNYDFIGEEASMTTSDCGYDSIGETAGYDAQYDTSSHGVLTGSKKAIIGNTGILDYLWSTLYYDAKGRVVQERKETAGLARKERVFSAYDFVGNLTGRRIDHLNLTNQVTHKETYTYGYDSWNRPTTTTHQLGTGSVVTLSSITYDTLGRPSIVDRNNAPNLGTVYAYNVRSWLTDITVGATGDTYRQKLYYNEARNGVSADTYQWSGNIARMDWKTGNAERVYQFSYDPLSRLTGATYSGPSGFYDNFTRSYGYDLNSNMTSYGEKTQANGWQMSTTTDNYDGNHLSASLYDANGNLLSGSGYVTSYNLLNLPESVSLNGQVTGHNYYYSATGEKLQKETKTGNIFEFVYYSGNMIFNDGTPKMILFDGGYIDLSGTTPAYRFYITDHQGNIRVVTDASGNILRTNHYDPYGQEVIPWPTTSSTAPLSTAGANLVSKYMYGGKEWDTTLSLYDFSARYYNPSANAFFSTMDPLCEKYYSISPYVYCAGNPVNLVDLWGLSYYYVGGEEYRIDDGDDNFKMSVTVREYERLKRLFDKGKGYARYRNKLSKTHEYTTTQTANVADADIEASVITVHQSGQSYLSYQMQASSFSSPLSIIGAIAGQAGNQQLLNRMQYGSNGRIYYTKPSGRRFYGNQYVTIEAFSKRFGKSLKAVNSINNLSYILSFRDVLNVFQYEGAFGINTQLLLEAKLAGLIGEKAGEYFGGTLGLMVGSVSGPGAVAAGFALSAGIGYLGSKVEDVVTGEVF